MSGHYPVLCLFKDSILQMIYLRLTNALFAVLMLTTSLTLAQTGRLAYPKTRETDQTDTYHGTAVKDPYRWLEDDRSPETAAWVQAENKVTFDYLGQIPYRKQLQARLEQVYNYPKYSAPNRKGEWFYFSKNDGLQNQSVLYRQKGLDGAPEVVIDPNTLSTDGTTRLTLFDLSKNGKYAAVGSSKAGSDWQIYRVMDMATKQMLPEKIEWVKFSGTAWQGDGFFYSRYAKPEGSALATKNEFQKVYFHKLGTAQETDQLVYEDKTHPLRYFRAQTTEDERFLFLNISEGTDGTEIWYRDLVAGDKSFKRLFEGFAHNYDVLNNIGDDLLVYHNNGAPNYKVSKLNTKTGQLTDFVAERPEKLNNASTAGGKLFVNFLKDVVTQVQVYDLASGKVEDNLIFPSPGTASGFGGEHDDPFVFYTFTSFTAPPTIYRYNIARKESVLFRTPEVKFASNDYATKQVFCTSKDGTRIPLFITHRKGLILDGENPTLLYGYGGFNVNLTPSFRATLIPFLEQGGVYVQMNLRGGGEYGETWHQQGMKLKKQNVFDDCIAAAEYLIAQQYTSPKKLALEGGSNGGLLVGAVVNQRPDLFRVAIPAVGVMDMLRFQKFTVGWGWVSDYGSSDNANEFKAIYAYSPLHNIKPGLNYPATLITTADHDDRVVPAHSFKYAATLQKAYKGENPILIRIETNSGHGSSNTKKVIEETADIYSFIFWNMGFKNLAEIR